MASGTLPLGSKFKSVGQINNLQHFMQNLKRRCTKHKDKLLEASAGHFQILGAIQMLADGVYNYSVILATN